MRSLLPLQRLNRLQRVPQSPVRRRPAAGPAIVTQAYAYDGATTYGTADITGTDYSAGLVLALWTDLVTVSPISGRAASVDKLGSSEILAWQPRDSNPWAYYTDEGGNSLIRQPTAPTPDSAGYYLAIAQVLGTDLRASCIGPSGETTLSGTMPGGGTMGNDLATVVLGGMLGGTNLGAVKIASAAIWIGDPDADDRAALYGDGLAIDWRSLSIAGLTLAHQWRHDQAYDDGSVRVPDDVGSATLTITAGDLADLTSTVPTGVL